MISAVAAATPRPSSSEKSAAYINAAADAVATTPLGPELVAASSVCVGDDSECAEGTSEIAKACAEDVQGPSSQTENQGGETETAAVTVGGEAPLDVPTKSACDASNDEDNSACGCEASSEATTDVDTTPTVSLPELPWTDDADLPAGVADIIEADVQRTFRSSSTFKSINGHSRLRRVLRRHNGCRPPKRRRV
jgi:hypothetical protein